MARRLRGCLGRLLAMALGLVLALFIAELAARILYPSPPGEVQVLTLNFGDPNPWAAEVGWAPRPNSVRRMILPGQYDTLYEVNALGIRGPAISDEKPEGVFRILLLGDSYVEAIQVAFEDTIQQQLQAMLNARPNGSTRPGGQVYEVIGVGTSGWGTANAYLYYLHEGRRFAPDIVVYVMIRNDPADNAPHLYEPGQRSLGPYFTLDETGGLTLHPGELAFGDEAGGEAIRWLDRTLRERSRLYAFLRDTFLWPWVTGTPAIQAAAPVPAASPLPTAESAPQVSPTAAPSLEPPPPDPRAAEAWAITRRILAQWGDQAAADGVTLVVFDAFQFARQELAAQLEAAGVPFLDTFDPYYDASGQALSGTVDLHWNAQGHHAAAEALYTFLDGRGLLP